MGNRAVILLVVGLLLGTLFVASAPSRAASKTIDLYGTAMGGWGFTPGSETDPGPTITVDQGDVITMNLHAEDGLPHQWLLDYNGNHVADTGEPVSAFFTSFTTFTFTATTAGGFTYLCTVHYPEMTGSWVTVPATVVHDVAITGVTTDKTSAVQGDLVTITAVVANLGTATETTTVAAFAGTTQVAPGQTATLAPGASQSLAFAWDTTAFAPGGYVVSAMASAVPGETSLGNNVFTDGTVTVESPPPPPGNLIAVLAGKSAWPSHHHFVISKAGNVQVLFGKMANVGPGPVNAKVVFTIRNDAGAVVGTVESNVVAIPVGGLGYVTASWSVQVGRFHVTAQCWFDSNGDGTFDGSDPGVKTFSFAVVP